MLFARLGFLIEWISPEGRVDPLVLGARSRAMLFAPPGFLIEWIGPEGMCTFFESE